MKNIARVLLGAAMALTLASCSGEPSASDMLAALNDHPKFAITLALIAGMGGNNPAQLKMLKESGTVDKSGCAAAQGMPGFVCDFRWGSKQPGGAVRYGAPVKARFFKSGNGWAVEM